MKYQEVVIKRTMDFSLSDEAIFLYAHLSSISIAKYIEVKENQYHKIDEISKKDISLDDRPYYFCRVNEDSPLIVDKLFIETNLFDIYKSNKDIDDIRNLEIKGEAQYNDKKSIEEKNNFRSSKVLVETIKKLKSKATLPGTHLVIEKIPIGANWYIYETYDGSEIIIEKK